jgi:hypothetical protein
MNRQMPVRFESDIGQMEFGKEWTYIVGCYNTVVHDDQILSSSYHKLSYNCSIRINQPINQENLIYQKEDNNDGIPL